ncbi:ammonium transporter [Aestuariimicrobium sp. T2.26MG-19.2B]|uniref:ammonium transporter n=1 Tax=Aestuariimicrobium sp. T2.26MG-19.2B TaxID=3040679 RepID=UPI0024776493|nr:ammonium transporter [Aestuariimicrobium sp. T2.26MG-19.2B]CAI9404887.1 Ammonia channel [Aestuariimicrobium sp. T2.26MG-19.2B]
MTILELNTGDTAWVLISAALVLLMTPALAFFYGGMVRSKSVLNMMMMSIVTMGIVSILWVLFGFSMSFGNSWHGLVGDPLQFAGMKGTFDTLVGPEGHQIPLLVFVGFQAAFAIIAVALVSGAVADRMKFSAWIVFATLWAVLVYFPAAHWVFAFDGFVAERGGWIANQVKAFDFAGGTAIHINAGAAALVLALVLGKRLGFGTKPMRPHNLTLVMLGAGLLWFGWFGFNAGSALGANGLAGLAWLNTLVATAGAMLAWLVVEKVRDGHPTSLGAASGIVAGLVGITPACATVTPLGAIAIGVLAGIACPLALSLKTRFGYDDALDVVGVHLVGGLVGTLAIGLFAKGSLTGGVAGLFYGGGFEQLGRQAIGAFAVMAYSGLVTLLIALAIKYTIGLRVSTDDEVSGVDITEHAENGYDFSRVGYSSYRVQQTLVIPAAPVSPVDFETTDAPDRIKEEVK